jgi:hypothetical protein
MVKKSFPIDSILYLGLFLGLFGYDFYSVIFPPHQDLLDPSHLLLQDPSFLHQEPHEFLYQDTLVHWQVVSGKELSRILENEQFMRDTIESFRSRAPVLQFNAELAVLSAAGRAGPTSLLQNNSSSVSSSSSSFNAASEALGDLFMSETYLQGDLDLDEITAVAGFLSKEVVCGDVYGV